MTILAQENNGLITAEELEQFPSDFRYELIRGVLREMQPPAGEEHGVLTFELSMHIGRFVKEHKLGRCYAAGTGFITSRNPDTVVAVDFAFISAGRILSRPIPGYVAIAPDIVLETRSTWDRKQDIAEKIERWLAAGVKMVIDLDPTKRQMTVCRSEAEPRVLTLEDTFFGEDVLPGFSLPIRKIFQDSV
jgi:Uma2 family endonuclease